MTKNKIMIILQNIAKKISDIKIKLLIIRICKEYDVDSNLAIAVASAESGLDPKAINIQGNYPRYSQDRGLFQWNNYWHKEISDKQAFDPEIATRLFCKAIKDGHLDWWRSSSHIWNKNNKYSKYLV